MNSTRSIEQRLARFAGDVANNSGPEERENPRSNGMENGIYTHVGHKDGRWGRMTIAVGQIQLLRVALRVE